MTERAKVRGSVRKHATRDLWEARYTCADGRRRSIYAPTEKECQVELTKALTLADNGIRPADGRATVADYLAEWLDTSVAQRLRPRTVESYRETVRLYHRAGYRQGSPAETDAGPRGSDAGWSYGPR